MRRSGRYKRKTGTAGLINEYGDDMQPGDIVHSARTTAPVGYLIANGAAVSRATYGNLFAALGTAYGAGDGATTFNLPDLRGEFIRGADQGRGVDAGRVLGSAQDEGIKDHTHKIGTSTARTGATLGLLRVADLYDKGQVEATQLGSSGLGTETRPRNVALLPLIKY